MNEKNTKEKILFWIDVSLLQFGIANTLQNKIDSDFYVIYDLNHHLKKSFNKQNIVNFKKEWYYWDYIEKPKNIDLEYLKTIEEKYKINLWEIAYTERNFYRYNPFYSFSREEILSIFEQECRFFEEVLDEVNPDYLIIKTTDFHRNHLFAEICRSRGIKILMLFASRLGYRSSISSQSDKIDFDLDEETQNTVKMNSFEEIRQYLKKHNKFAQVKKIHSGGMNYPIRKKISPSITWLTKTFDEKFKNTYDHYGVTRRKAISHYVIYSLKGKIRKKFIDKNFKKEINFNKKFILFPLQVQPERNVDIDAPFYANQIDTIVNISKALPVNYKLFVKEHQSMRFRHWRSIKEYKEILELPNVEMIHPSAEPEKILKNCSMVITIAGSAGLEAALYEKPTIVFTDTIYTSLPSVHRLTSLEELPNAIKESLKKEVKVSDVNEFINLLERNSFEFDISGYYNKILERFHNGGFMISDNISMNELNTFLEKDQKIFEMLADEHFKIISKYRKRRI